MWPKQASNIKANIRDDNQVLNHFMFWCDFGFKLATPLLCNTHQRLFVQNI